MSLGSSAQPPKVRLAKQFRSSAVLADASTLVGNGVLLDVSDPLLAEAVVADLYKPVSQLVGLQKLNELLFLYAVASGKINGRRFAQHSQSVLGR